MYESVTFTARARSRCSRPSDASLALTISAKFIVFPLVLPILINQSAPVNYIALILYNVCKPAYPDFLERVGSSLPPPSTRRLRLASSRKDGPRRSKDEHVMKRRFERKVDGDRVSQPREDSGVLRWMRLSDLVTGNDEDGTAFEKFLKSETDTRS